MIITSTTFAKAISAPLPGGTLTLQGDFPEPLFLDRLTFAKPITLDCRSATLRTIFIRNCTGVRILGGVFAGMPATAYPGAIYVADSGQVVIDGARVQAQGDCCPVTFRNASDFSLLRSTILGGSVSVQVSTGSRGLIQQNKLLDYSADGVDLADAHGVEVAWNVMVSGDLEAGMQPDGVQFWTILPASPTSDVHIHDNMVFGYQQGLGGNGDGPYVWINIERNWIMTGGPAPKTGDGNGAPTGIGFSPASRSRICDNSLKTLPGTDDGWQTRIRLDKPTDTVRSGNVVAAYGTYPAEIDAPTPPSSSGAPVNAKP